MAGEFWGYSAVGNEKGQITKTVKSDKDLYDKAQATAIAKLGFIDVHWVVGLTHKH